MKQYIIILLATVAMTTQADDFTYNYLVMTANDGTKTSVSVTDLNMTFADGRLSAVNADGTRAFDLVSLASMAFSETIEESGNTTTDICLPDSDAPAEVFTLSGMAKGTFGNLTQMKKTLPAGIYIVKQNGKTTKITIQK